MGSQTAHLKYNERLSSLERYQNTRWGNRKTFLTRRPTHRTVHKFCKFENFVRHRQATLKLVNKSVDKLQEYESKFLNLNVKFNVRPSSLSLSSATSKYSQVLFDRIRVRCLHSKMSEAHAEAQRIRTAEHANRDSFKTQWAEGKAQRAALRRDYHAYRNGRRPSLVS